MKAPCNIGFLARPLASLARAELTVRWFPGVLGSTKWAVVRVLASGALLAVGIMIYLDNMGGGGAAEPGSTRSQLLDPPSASGQRDRAHRTDVTDRIGSRYTQASERMSDHLDKDLLLEVVDTYGVSAVEDFGYEVFIKRLHRDE